MQGPTLKEGDTVVYSAAVRVGSLSPDGDDSRSFLIDRNQVHMGRQTGRARLQSCSREELKFHAFNYESEIFYSRSG